MVLEHIASPADVRAVAPDELDDLAAEIREEIVEAVQTHGGHLGSNLGVVELTLALHRVFESPRDIILWDTGHQAYVHKMITGRRRRLREELRQTDGLSGYPSREESEHDWVENSHASTVLSYAHGLAVAEKAKGSNRRIVAVIGDGAMTGGLAFEGLNNLGHSSSNVTIVLNDNGRSYAPTVTMLGDSLARIRANPRYLRSQNKVFKLLSDLPVVGKDAGRTIDAAKAAVREMWEPTSFFENLGVRYTGPFDGHDVAGLERAIRNVAALPGPNVVHVITEKGRGYAPAENDPVKRMHDLSTAKQGSYTHAFTEALMKEAENRPEVVAITAAMPDSTGLLPFSERYPDRVFDVGIAEQHAVTAAAGMAMGGLRPVFAVYSTFLTRAIDQVNMDVGLHRQPVVFCLDRAGITGDDGPSHHGVLDMVLLSKVPGMTVFAPSSYQELQQMLADALDITSGPVAIRWPKTAAASVDWSEVGAGLRGRRIREGVDVCILSVGKMLEPSVEAADRLAGSGIEATVWDMRCVKPLDPDMIADAAAHSLVVTIEDGLADGGAGAAARAAIVSRAVGTPPRVEVLGVPSTFIPQGQADEILHRLGLDADGVVETVMERLR